MRRLGCDFVTVVMSGASDDEEEKGRGVGCRRMVTICEVRCLGGDGVS